MINLLKRDISTCKYKLYRQTDSKKIYWYKKYKEQLKLLQQQIKEELL